LHLYIGNTIDLVGEEEESLESKTSNEKMQIQLVEKSILDSLHMLAFFTNGDFRACIHSILLTFSCLLQESKDTTSPCLLKGGGEKELPSVLNGGGWTDESLGDWMLEKGRGVLYSHILLDKLGLLRGNTSTPNNETSAISVDSEISSTQIDTDNDTRIPGYPDINSSITSGNIKNSDIDTVSWRAFSGKYMYIVVSFILMYIYICKYNYNYICM
jgi:hypothetical protein